MKFFTRQSAHGFSTMYSQLSAATIVTITRFAKLFSPNTSMLGSWGFFNGNANGNANSNVNTVTSIALYSLSIVLFDVFNHGFYPGFLFTYLGFAGYFLLGKLAKQQIKRQMILLPVASLLFFLVSNFGVWLYWYSHSWSSLVSCYVAALPFYKNTLLGDLVFGYGYLAVKHLLTSKVSLVKRLQLAV